MDIQIPFLKYARKWVQNVRHTCTHLEIHTYAPLLVLLHAEIEVPEETAVTHYGSAT
jgi:hypothetical protein